MDHWELVSSRVRARRTRARQGWSKTCPTAFDRHANPRHWQHTTVLPDARRDAFEFAGTVCQRPAIDTCTTHRNGLQDSGQHP
ncbi:hypothetical protein ACFV84_24520 [Kitasatospora sp. NPDC059811]|uniref:hypothetical protein n=1 Tax=Streptomycetaceae TaxID=2062 RepID=UPI001331A476|nr:hypothetical protein [Streptomyces sp. MJM8645]